MTSGTADPAPQAAVEPAAGRTVLFSAVKNEGPFLLEWVAYHRAIGFERIVVASNDSDDGTAELLDAMASSGAIDLHLRHAPPAGRSAQMSAAQALAAADPPRAGDWFLWLDADEFLNIHLGQGHVADLVALIGARHGMLIPWRVFGAGGQTGLQTRFLTPGFDSVSPDAPADPQIKTLFRYAPGVLDVSPHAFHRPRVDPAAGLSAADFLTGSGGTATLADKADAGWLKGKERARNSRVGLRDFGRDCAQINHYAVRTPELFELKKRRGRGFHGRLKGGRDAPPVRHDDAFFAAHDCRGATDRTILRHADALEREVARILSDPQTAACVAQTTRRTQDRLAEAERQDRPAADGTVEELFLPGLTFDPTVADFVTDCYARADAILEYGSGGSTVLAAGQAHSAVVAVESDRDWARRLRATLAARFPRAPVRVHWVDIGETGKWGRPRDTAKAGNWPAYPLEVWDLPDAARPDLVLIDGRFRVGCFFATLFRTARPVTVLWDDYVDRPAYHLVEDFARPVETVGRMARFELGPRAVPPEALGVMARAFVDPD